MRLIDAFRRKGGKRGMPLNIPKSAFCIFLPMQCIINLCSKTNEIDTVCSHFQGFSCPNSNCCQGSALDRPLPSRSPVLLAVFSLDFGLGPLGPKFFSLNPISGYTYVKAISNNI